MGEKRAPPSCFLRHSDFSMSVFYEKQKDRFFHSPITGLEDDASFGNFLQSCKRYPTKDLGPVRRFQAPTVRKRTRGVTWQNNS